MKYATWLPAAAAAGISAVKLPGVASRMSRVVKSGLPAPRNDSTTLSAVSAGSSVDVDRNPLPARSARNRLVRDPRVGAAADRGGRRPAAAPLAQRRDDLVERRLDLGVGQALGHLDVGLDLERLAEVLRGGVALLEPGQQDHAQVQVGARGDRVLVEPGFLAEVERVLEDLARLLEVQVVVLVESLLVELGDRGRQVVLVGLSTRDPGGPRGDGKHDGDGQEQAKGLGRRHCRRNLLATVEN